MYRADSSYFIPVKRDTHFGRNAKHANTGEYLIVLTQASPS